jgi:hypothetical protein
MATELPEQIVALFTVKVGVVLTLTVDTMVLEAGQPLAAVPVTEYDVVAFGDTVKFPPLIVYVLAPEGTMATELPEQIVALFTLSVGVVLTDIVETAVFEATQAFVPVPVTE